MDKIRKLRSDFSISLQLRICKDYLGLIFGGENPVFIRSNPPAFMLNLLDPSAGQQAWGAKE
ncbi:hypothetical protein C0431_10580 [bacterium]|nr:hypothetical protein [bacterium]